MHLLTCPYFILTVNAWSMSSYLPILLIRKPRSKISMKWAVDSRFESSSLSPQVTDVPASSSSVSSCLLGTRWGMVTKSKAHLFVPLCRWALKAEPKMKSPFHPSMSSMVSSFPSVTLATDDLEERFAGFPAETDLWASPWKQSKAFAGFVFLGWFIWQGPILYIIFRVSKPFSSAKVSRWGPRRNRREPMYVIADAMLSGSRALPFDLSSDPEVTQAEHQGLKLC